MANKNLNYTAEKINSILQKADNMPAEGVVGPKGDKGDKGEPEP